MKSTGQKLNRDARRFIQFQVLFTGMGSILTLFVNTFLMNAFGSYSKEVLLYNVVLAVVQPAAMLTAMFLIQKKTALFTQRIGFLFYGAALAALCLFGDRVSPFYPLFAAMLSFGAGYYYTVYSSQMLCYTNDGNRDQIAGILGLLGSVISIFMPMISGVMISHFGTVIGYRIVFGIAAALAIGALITSAHLPPIPKHEKKSVLPMVAKKIFSSRDGRLIMISNGLSNCRGFTLPIFVTLLFYNLMPDELMISLNSTIGYIVALLGAAVYGSTVKHENRSKASVLAAITVTLPALGMLFGLNIVVIMIFNAVNGFFTTFQSTPVLNTHFKVMEKLGLRSEYGGEVHLIRELFVSAGRVFGLGIVWIVPKTNVGAVVVLLFMMITALIDAMIIWTIDRI